MHFARGPAWANLNISLPSAQTKCHPCLSAVIDVPQAFANPFKLRDTSRRSGGPGIEAEDATEPLPKIPCFLARSSNSLSRPRTPTQEDSAKGGWKVLAKRERARGVSRGNGCGRLLAEAKLARSPLLKLLLCFLATRRTP